MALRENYVVTITVFANPHHGAPMSYGSHRWLAKAVLFGVGPDMGARIEGVGNAGSKERAASLAVRDLLSPLNLRAAKARSTP